jgi:EF-hand domain pair
MSISSVGNSVLLQLYPNVQKTKSSANQTSTSPQATPPSSASTVTLSPEAQSFASLNEMGVTVTLVSGRGLSSGIQPVPFPGGSNGVLSQASFQQVLESYGAISSEAQQIFSAADTNQDGSISNSELLGAMSSTATSTSPEAQRLLQLMDTNHNGSVSGTEYVTMETSMVQAETPAT